MDKILVTGGCGYIGSHTIIDLIEHGFDVISVDNNIRSSTSMLNRIQKITGRNIPHYPIDLCDLQATQNLFKAHPDILGVIHFAAYKSVPESVINPLFYYRNNLNSLINVLDCIHEYKVPYFVFSSSCSVYGNIQKLPVTEDTPLAIAESPYANTKQMGEDIVLSFSKAFPNHKTILLRYFNPGGAHPSGKIGEILQEGGTNIIPVMIEGYLGLRAPLSVHGNDYDTRDGSCIRDYIHIMDLANAHTKSFQYLQNTANVPSLDVFNVGIGEGVTVFELIKAFEKAVGETLNYTVGGRRIGDVSAIYANYEKANRLLGWSPKYSIDEIMKSAWVWYQYYQTEQEA
ncbi:MAG: UDP-glucose 4-epimerase GalE [Aureispira sp.]|nr:UDP-glucose 4-epimerase GalE [Aureispira sp.]